MNRFFTLLLAASCLTAVGQVTYPYNPDSDSNGLIGAEDLMSFLSFYNGIFEPNSVEYSIASELELVDSLLIYGTWRPIVLVPDSVDIVRAFPLGLTVFQFEGRNRPIGFAHSGGGSEKLSENSVVVWPFSDSLTAQIDIFFNLGGIYHKL